MSSVKSRCTSPSAKSNRFPRAAAALALVALGGGVSLHLHANHVSHWWLPLVLLVVAHGAIIGGIAWLIARHRRRNGSSTNPAGRCENHEHGEHSVVIRTPRRYDWLVRALTLGGERKFRRRTLDLAELRSGETVLDVGCGTGTLLIEAARRVGPAGSVHGIEMSAEMVAHARRKAKAQAVTLNVLEGSADRLPFPDASFDVVFCTMVLHHLPPAMQVAAIGEMRRVLRSEGRIVIVDLERPKTIAAALSLVTLFHKIGSHATAPDWQHVELLLNQQGVRCVGRHTIWGGAVSITVGRNG